MDNVQNVKERKTQMKEKQSGITLIALVITVIVLLILAGAAISIGLNQNNLFEKANEAKEDWNAKVTEEDQKIGETWDLLRYINNGNDGGTATSDKIEEACISEDGQLIVLKETGELCKSGYTSRDGDLVKYDSENEEKIADNVKEFNNNYYYITNSDTLYLFDGTKVADDVKKVYQDAFLYYLTNSNELYNYDLNKKISNDVKKFVPGNFYLKSNNELYRQDGTKVSDNVKDICGDYYYIMEDNNLYMLNRRKDIRRYKRILVV